MAHIHVPNELALWICINGKIFEKQFLSPISRDDEAMAIRELDLADLVVLFDTQSFRMFDLTHEPALLVREIHLPVNSYVLDALEKSLIKEQAYIDYKRLRKEYKNKLAAHADALFKLAAHANALFRSQFRSQSVLKSF